MAEGTTVHLATTETGAAGEAATAAPPARRAWPLRVYFALLCLSFIAAAAAAVAYVEVQTGSDAEASGLHTAGAAAATAAAQLGATIGTLRATVQNLAANPQVAQTLVHPAGCTLTFDLGDISGHIDIVTPKGAVVCSSRKRGTAIYAGQRWIHAALARPTFTAPAFD